jgi:3-methyl-2-oxobutanoate hydroxymethyltransferase
VELCKNAAGRKEGEIMEKLSIPELQGMKRDGRKIVGVVAWDTEMARIADRAGVDLISVGDSVGVNLWGYAADAEVTLDEILICCKAVRRGAKRALVSCDVPNGPVQAGSGAAVAAALRLAREGGADMVKVLGDPGMVKAIVRAGVPVFAEFHGEKFPVDELVEEAKRLEEAGASLLDFRHSGPVAGPAVVRAVSIPVIGGLGGGPWLDGRVRLAHTAIGYAAKWIDANTETYGNAAKLSFDAFRALIDDVRSGRQIKGG